MAGIPFQTRHQLILLGSNIGWPLQYRTTAATLENQPMDAGRYGRQPFDIWAQQSGQMSQQWIPRRPYGFIWPWERDHNGVPYGPNRRGVWFARNISMAQERWRSIGVVGFNFGGPTYNGQGQPVNSGDSDASGNAVGIQNMTNMGGGLFATRQDLWRRHTGPYVLFIDRANAGEIYNATVTISACNGATGLLNNGQMSWYLQTAMQGTVDPIWQEANPFTTPPLPQIDQPCVTDPRLAKATILTATLGPTELGSQGMCATDGFEVPAGTPGGLMMLWIEVQWTGPVPPAWRIVDLDRLICDNASIVPQELGEGWEETWDHGIDRGGARGGLAQGQPWQANPQLTAASGLPLLARVPQNQPTAIPQGGITTNVPGGQPEWGHARLGQAEQPPSPMGGNLPNVTSFASGYAGAGAPTSFNAWLSMANRSSIPSVMAYDGTLVEADQMPANGLDSWSNIWNDGEGWSRATQGFYNEADYARSGLGPAGLFRAPAISFGVAVPIQRGASVTGTQIVTGPQIGLNTNTGTGGGLGQYTPAWIGGGWRGGKCWYQLNMPATGAPLETADRTGLKYTPAAREGSFWLLTQRTVVYHGWAGQGGAYGDCRYPPGYTSFPYDPSNPAPPCSPGYTWTSSFFTCSTSYPAQCGITNTTPNPCGSVSGQPLGLCRAAKGAVYCESYDAAGNCSCAPIGGQYYDFEFVGWGYRSCDFTLGQSECYNCSCAGICSVCNASYRFDFTNFGVILAVGQQCESGPGCSVYSGGVTWVTSKYLENGGELTTQQDVRYKAGGGWGPQVSGHRGTLADAWAPGDFDGCNGDMSWLIPSNQYPNFYAPSGGCGAIGAIFGVMSYYPGTDSDASLRRCGIRICPNECGVDYLQRYTTTVGGICSCGYQDQTGQACSPDYTYNGPDASMCPSNSAGATGVSAGAMLASYGWYTPLGETERTCDGGEINEVRIELRHMPDWGIPPTTAINVAELYAACSELAHSIVLTPNVLPYSGGCYAAGQMYVCAIGATPASNCSGFPQRYGWELPSLGGGGPCGVNRQTEYYYGQLFNGDYCGSVGVIDIPPIPCPKNRGWLVAFAVVDHEPMEATIVAKPTSMPASCNECQGTQPCTGAIPCPPQYETFSMSFQSPWLAGSFTLYLAPTDDIPLPFAVTCEDGSFIPGGVKADATRAARAVALIPYDIPAFPYTQPTVQLYGPGMSVPTQPYYPSDANWSQYEVPEINGVIGLFRFPVLASGIYRVKVTPTTPTLIGFTTASAPFAAQWDNYQCGGRISAIYNNGIHLQGSGSPSQINGKTTTLVNNYMWGNNTATLTYGMLTGPYYAPVANHMSKMLPIGLLPMAGNTPGGDGLLKIGQTGLFAHLLMPQCKPVVAPTDPVPPCVTGMNTNTLSTAQLLRSANNPMQFDLELVPQILTPFPGPGTAFTPLNAHVTSTLLGEVGGPTQFRLGAHAFYSFTAPADGKVTVTLAGTLVYNFTLTDQMNFGVALAMSTVDPYALDDLTPTTFIGDAAGIPGIQAASEFAQVPLYSRPARPGNAPTAVNGFIATLTRTITVKAGDLVYVRISPGYPYCSTLQMTSTAGNLFQSATLVWTFTP